MRKINLTQNKYTLVDDDMYEYLIQWKWYAHNMSGKYYANRRDVITNKTILMHREILGAKKGDIIDHKNGDPLDNRACNLRLCTSKQNSRNSKIHKNNTTGYKGIVLHKPTGKYHSRIVLDGKKLSLGYFDNPVDAALAYDKKALELFGEFAFLNFPD